MTWQQEQQQQQQRHEQKRIATYNKKRRGWATYSLLLNIDKHKIFKSSAPHWIKILTQVNEDVCKIKCNSHFFLSFRFFFLVLIHTLGWNTLHLLFISSHTDTHTHTYMLSVVFLHLCSIWHKHKMERGWIRRTTTTLYSDG